MWFVGQHLLWLIILNVFGFQYKSVLPHVRLCNFYKEVTIFFLELVWQIWLESKRIACLALWIANLIS